MKKQFKIIILIVMCLAIVGIYLGKNIYFKKENTKQQVATEIKKVNIKGESSPVLLEFSTET